MGFKRYIAIVLAAGAALVGGVAAFNGLVDPYALFGAPRIAGFNAVKPAAGDHVRVAKIYQVRRAKPRGLIVGNSRPELGLDPESPCWPVAARPVFNDGLPGADFYPQVLYAADARAVARPQAMLVAVDFTDFLIRLVETDDPHRWPPAVPPERSFLVETARRAAGGFTAGWPKDYADATVSLEAFADSVLTVLRQRQSPPVTRTALGFNPAAGIYEPILRAEGAAALFAAKNAEIAERVGASGLSVYDGGGAWSSAFEGLKRLVADNKEAGTDTVLIIDPYHAEYLMTLDLAGQWLAFEDWKRTLADLARQAGVPLWDFALFDEHATEPLAGVAARGEGLRWFWEPSHYRQELGDLMLANIWRETCPAAASAPAYGTRLDRADVDIHLAAEDARKDAYAAANPDVVARLRGYVRERER